MEMEVEDVMWCVRAFVDILHVSCGYQSSGHLVFWDSQNIHKALQWASFVETVLEKIPVSEEGNASKQTLDMALSELKSNPLVPQGLSQLSFAALAESRKILLENLLQAVNLRENHLSSILTVVCEMDSSELRDNSKPSMASNGVYRSAGNELELVQKTGVPLSIDKESDSLKKQAEVFVSQCYGALDKETINEVQASDGEFQKTELGIKSVHHSGGVRVKENSYNRLSDYIIQEITKRHVAVACTTSLEEGLKVVSDSVLEVRSEHQIWEDITNLLDTSRHGNFTREIELWRQWKNNGLSYLLDKKTLSMVSGASLIFDTTKLQWYQVLESLSGPTEKLDDHKILEIVELCLLGLSSKKWSYLIRRFTSATYRVISLSKIWHCLQNNLRDSDLHWCAKGKEIEDYLLQLLSNKMQLLWKMPPVLVASSLDVRSALFSLYMDEIQNRIRNDGPTTRYFSSGYDTENMLDCEINERLWCFYILQLNQNSDTFGRVG